VAAVIWALYAFFIGRIGGQAFEDNVWAGLGIAFAVSVAVSGVIEGARRLWRHARKVEAGHPGQDQADRDKLHGRDRVA
jgi:membrane protein DedA with SNARE-associated domain